MSHVIAEKSSKSIFSNNIFWMAVGTLIFISIGFIIPVPGSLVQVVEQYGFAKTMIDRGIAGNSMEAASKTMIVLGIMFVSMFSFVVMMTQTDMQAERCSRRIRHEANNHQKHNSFSNQT